MVEEALDDLVGIAYEAEHARIEEVAVDRIEHAYAFDLVTFKFKSGGVGLAFIAQGSVFGGYHERARLVGKILF